MYAYSAEDYEWWSSKLGGVLEPGTFGDNLTVAGFDPSDAVIGSRWRIGTAVLAGHAAAPALFQARDAHG